MNKSIIALKEMINFSNIQRESMFVGLRHIFLALLLLTAGAGSAWAQDPYPTVWDGTEYSFKEKDFANENLAVDDHDGKSWETAYVITNARQLAYFAWIVKNNKEGRGSNYYWKLGASIDLGGHNWMFGGNAGGAFQGHFDGQSSLGYTISNLALTVDNNSNFGLLTTIQGASATNLAEVKNLKISSVTFTSGAPRGGNTRLGGLAGYVNKANISNVSVSGVTFTYTSNGSVTGTNQLGGAIGCVENYTNINNVTVNGVTATLSGVNASGTNDAVNLDVAGLIGYAKGEILTISGNTVSNVSIITTGRTNATRLAGLVGYVETNGTGGKLTIKGNTVSTVGITAKGNVVGGTYLGGLIGYAKGKASPNNRTLVQGNTVTSPTVAMNGETNSTFCMGGLIGYADTNTDVFNNKVASPAISITNTINAETYVGGAVGRQAGYTTIDGMTVSGGSITGPSANKNVNNNKNFFVGGFIGQQNSSGPEAYKPNVFRNIAVTDININLEKYQPATTITNHKFAVGGIAGCVNAPNKDVNGFCGMPENIIFKGGKIYAPYATTSPTVSNFNASNPSHNTMTTEVVTTIDALDKAKTKTWYYSNYELGLSQDFLNSTAVIADNATTAKDKFHKNYTSSATITVTDGISYLTVNNSTFQKSNRYQDSERDSKTVLWWTNTAGYNAAGASADMFTNEEQPIYPHQAGASPIPAATSFPYYWYFFQGVSNANYVTSDVATKIIEGIAGNKTEAAKDHPITLTISNPNENERGFDQCTISVVAKTTDNEGNVVDANTGITGYQWYVNGVANGTGTSIKLTPHWKDGQGITVNALNGATVVATATYTLAPGVLKTKTGSSEKIRSDINGRGTKANPYIIDCENALRQWSYLSTVQTGTLWEGLVKPVAPFPTNQIAGHYGRAYYELGADITMGTDPFIPISHVGYGSDGTWGTYTNNFSFQGNFDGKGYKISGLKITWGAGQYKGNDANIYHGLFGIVGHSTATAKWGDGSTTSNTVIQNLVIENATLTHDVNNTTFSYKKNYSHFPASANENNCMVGVLAGIVAANTTVQNIEIRGSKITDEGSSDYSLATKGLFVGGAIGSVQAQYNNTNIPTNTIIKNIVVGTDIELTHAMIQDLAFAQQGAYNVGGIIGRFASTNGNFASTQAVMPKYLLYTGSIKACYTAANGKKDAMISPVIAATRYSNNKDINDKNFSKIWEGNNNDKEQLTVADALYYNFKISDASGAMHLVTEDYPNKVCSQGARAQDTHTDGLETAGGYLGQRYQGVNYNAIFCDAATYGDDADGGKRMAIAILNSHNDVDVYWEWTPGDATPHMTNTPTAGAYIVRDAETADKYNVVGTAATAGKYYKWYVGGVELTGDDKHSSSITVPADISETNIKAEVYDNSSASSPIATTQYLVIKGEFKVNTSIKKEGDTYTVGLDRGGVDLTTNTLGDRITVTYQWYRGNAVNVNTAEELSCTTKSITIDKATLGEVNNLFCHVTISTTGADPKVLFTGDISQYVREANVVYLQLYDVKASNGTTYSASAAGQNTGSNDSYGVKQADYASAEFGKTPDKPVKSWAEAYALLKPYTEPTSANVQDGKYKTSAGTLTDYAVTWTSATNYDFSNVPLDEYEFDVYKRDNFKRKVKPIDQCTNNWNNNVIVLMGLSKDGYFNNSETTMHNIDGKIANKPVTITGQWDGTNYYGYLSNLSGDFSNNADHKFEKMGLGVLDKGIGATESIRYRIYAHRWNVHAGKGLLMGWAAALEWGIEQTDANKKIYKITSADVSTGTPVGKYACDIAIMGGYLNDNTSTNPEMFEYINHGRDDIGQQIKIESGFWGPVCPGNRQTDSGNTINTYYTMGGPDHPAKTTITVDIDREWNDQPNHNYYNSAMSPATVDIGCLLTGNHEGTMYADVTLNILSGKMGRMVNGIKGAQRRQIKNPDSFTTGGVYRHTVKYGDTWTPVAAPAPDSYFGRGILNFDPSQSVNNKDAGNNGVNVVELYCGGLGRGHNDGSYHPEVRSYFYGLCEVNIKGGTFQKTIYGSGAGGTNGIGTATNHTDDDGLPYWKTSDGRAHVWYAPYEYAKANGEFVKVKITGTGSDDENLEGGYVNLEKTRNIINITGGIFGSEEKPVSIYAGGNGETDAALINPSGTKVGDVKNTYNTPNHQAGNMYGAADGLTTEINISGNAKIYGSIFGGGRGTMRYYRYFLRAADDIVAYTKDNQEYTRIWNPKRSSNGDYNTNGGADWNNIINSRKNADRYLNLGQVYGNTKVTISGNVEILGNVYGGGEGVSDITVDELFSEADSELGLTNQLSNKSSIIDYAGTATNGKRSAHVDWTNDKFVNFPGMGKIFGNAGVEISGNVTIHGNVYGGGKAGAIQGTTNVDVKGSVNIFGEVYGAGQGLLVDKSKNYKEVATIIGDATVNLSENATIWQDMFGGGENAVVDGDTHFNMSGGHVAANVFGGGKGDIKKNNAGTAYEYVNDKLVITSADIYGNTNVDITGGDIVWNRTSMASATSSSLTTHIFTKTTEGEAGSETYYTTESTTAAVKEYFENEGYTNVSVTAGDPQYTEETVDEVTVRTYKYEVTYKYPSTTDTKTFTDAELAKDGKTLDQKKTELSEYEYSFRTENTGLAKGEIVYWNTDDIDPETPPLVDESDSNHKIHNELFYDKKNKKFLIKHNIFGGGYVACRVGTYNDAGVLQNKKDESSNELIDDEGNVVPTGRSRVSMVSGLFGVDLMGTQQWKDCYNDNQDPHFYVFGGGFGAYTSVGKTQVQIGVNEEILEAAGETEEQWAKPGNLNFGTMRAKSGGPKKVIGGTTDDPEIGIADQQYGEPGYTILGVLGGGYAGIVTGNTDVRVGGNTFMHRIYGGGYGQLAAYNELKSTDNICVGIGTFNKNREDLGMVMGNTYVKTDGGFVQGDVFGGGAGVESAWLDGTTYKELDNTHATAAKDFTMGEVKGATEVEITGETFVQRSVFGGGDVANVLGGTVGTGENDPKQTSTVTVKSGTVVANVFGGGNGRLVSQVTPGSVVDNTVTVGAIFGNTLVTIEDTKNEETGEIISSPDIYGDIYGGCGYGQIKVHSTPANGAGNTVVNINGGNIGGNVYGGGLGKEAESNTSANIAGTTNVTINGGTALWDKISDDNGNISKWDVVENILTTDAERTAVRLALVTGDTQIFKTLLAGKVSDKFFDVEKLEYTKNHNIYGGGDRVCKVAGKANVTVNHALVTDATILNPNNTAGLCWAASIDNKEHPQFSVFGGGYGPNTTVANTEVKYQCGHNANDYTYESQEADRKNWLYYFGGLAQNWGNLDSKDKDENYGGDNAAGIWRYAVSQLAWSSGIPNLIMRGVFGGGYAGLVSGNTDVTVSDASCLRYVYGGGLGSKDYLDKYNKAVATNLYNRLGEVAGNSTVTISGGVVSKEVYGGGAGIEPKKLGSDTDYTDLVDMARVKGKTSVIISGSPSITEEGANGTVIIGDVFGGGDVANVGMEDATIYGTSPVNNLDEENKKNFNYITSNVLINSGCMLGQVFAGGNGRTKELCSGADANGVFGYQKVGAIYGNTLLTVNGYDDSSSDGQGGSHDNITYVFKRMFGGGNNGSIRKTTGTGGDKNSGHTYVTVNGGYFAYNVFGGGVGTINTTVNEETGETIDNNTYSYVEGSTHVKMLGGLAIVDQYWDKPQTIQITPDKTIEVGLRQWAPLNEKDGKKYSAQYDPEHKKLLINHNIYAGCRNAGYVLGNTYLTMNKGYIRSGLRAGAYEGVADNFFESQEWEEIYSKIGSPHFCIFGGGFGENTHIKGDTFVDIDIDATDKNLGLTSPVELSEDHHALPAAQRFEGGQSVMDIIGGGYSGDVAGATHVKISHDVFARRIFGGSFYAPVSQTNIMINSINCDDIFGGGMMGDVRPTTVKGYTLESGAGNTNVVIGTPGATANDKIFINNNVYGGNDVSGEVTGQINASIFGGKIYNNVYGAGNGNYLYALNDKVQKVTTHEYYEANGQTYDLVYEVPLQARMDFNVKSATDAQKIVNINTYRPMAEKVVLNIAGTESKPLSIGGNVFGGGNTATVSSLSGNRPSVTMNIGSYCTIGGVYMGADGEAMFQEKSGFMGAFQNINGVDLTNPIDWVNNVANKSIGEEFLPVAKANRNKIYPHVLDLYFEPVEMSVQPTLNWCNNITLDNAQTLAVTATPAPSDLTNTTIGVFVAGGNRGNMNVEPWNGSTANYGGNVAEAGQIINYEFPAGLTITNRIVGGCNEANYTLGKVTHVGGYLLGGREHDGTEINLLVQCQFAMPQGMTSLLSGGKPLTDSEGNPVEQRNVYGGCYKSGTIYGDINIDFRSSMLTSDNTGNQAETVAKAYFSSEIAMGNVYGAGYGPESYVYGDTKVTVNPTKVMKDAPGAKGMRKTGEKIVDNNAYAAMSVYGGGQQGNVIGNTTVRILNGHLGKSAVGGSYAGYMWGSTQVLVGYPSYYTAQKGGKYKMFRADKWNVGEDYKNHNGSDVVKQEIYLMPGDIVSEEVFNAIKAYDDKNSTSQATTGDGKNFSAKVTETPAGGWDGINITIDEAAYGGGYSLASGSSVAAGTYTVKKYDSTMNLDGDYNMSLLTNFVNHEGNNTTKDYGGNTTVLVWDNNAVDQENDHIKISTQTMKQVTPEEGADLFGYYVKENKNGVEGYRYIYQEGEYFYTKDSGNTNPQYFKQAFESDSEGGMYGDGHLSFAEGFRTGELVGYGFAGYRPNGALVINTFQRMDILRIKDCAVSVLGARDYTVSEVSTTPYSLARISELHMEAENVTNFGSGALAATSERHSRNYLGLSNNIHYVGAVNSNVDFNASYHYGNKSESNANGAVSSSKTYRQEKQAYVDDYKTNQNDAEFQKRNDGTAANMIGISSGYAMKVQNVKTTDAKGKEEYFYGPIVGVVEMNLIDVREDEGGGYVYADNIHHRSSTAMNYSNPNYNQVPGAYEAAEDFLETSGNFVFPYDKVKNRYIVDDCFSKGFSKGATTATEDGHYWYVTGYNYYYNAHITGYTYNSSDDMLAFDSDNDNLLTLTDARVGQQVTLQSLKWRSNHVINKDDNGFIACDLESPIGDIYKDITSSLTIGTDDVSSYFTKDVNGDFVQAVGTAASDTHYYQKTPATLSGYTSVSLEQDDDLTGYYTNDGAGNYTLVESGTYDTGAGITYYSLANYKNITEALNKASDVSSYYTGSVGSYTKASGHYVDGTTYYLYVPEAYENITSTLKSGDALSEYYTLNDGVYSSAVGTYSGTGIYYKHIPASYNDVTEKLKAASSVSYCYTADGNAYTPVTSGYFVTGTQYYVQLGNGNTPVSAIEQDEKYNYDHYNLFVGTTDAEGKYDESGAHWANLPLTEDLASNANRVFTNTLSKDSPTLAFQLTDKVDNSGNDYFQKYMSQPCEATVVLTCPATEEDGTAKMGYVPISYFFTRTGSAPNYTYTKLADNTQLTADTEYYYFGNGNDYHAVNSNDLYYYHKAQERYVSVLGDDALSADKPATYYENVTEYNDAKQTSLTEDQFTALSEAAKVKTPAEKAHEAGEAITAAKLISGSEEYTFYDYTNRMFTYTIYLTIDYVQGPDVTGNIKIYNCALPGEKIKIDKGTIDIKSDQSLSQESAIWEFSHGGNTWRFDQAYPFDPEADKNKSSEMLKDVEFVEQDGGYILVPAYYFMNGYKVQYLFTVNGIDKEFRVPVNPNGQDKLTIHNYHRMKPRNADGVNRAPVDFKLDLAAERAASDPNFAEPRIYIADAADLNEFARFVEEKKPLYYDLEGYNEAKGTTLTAEQFDALPSTEKLTGEFGAEGSMYNYGKNMQFHLLNDIAIRMTQEDHYGELDGEKKGTAAHGFKGTFNGNGYVISGFGKKTGDFTAPAYLFDNTTVNKFKTAETVDYNIYNLGVVEGKIMKSDNSTTSNANYHCSYSWADKVVYRMDGTAVNSYSDNDWRYGKVTFDLNQYYLDKRATEDPRSTREPRDSRESHYVEDLFHNGDYLYARWKTASDEYLRTADASQYDANYNSATSYHYYTLTDGVLTHPVDESRAVYETVDEVPTLTHYAPLYEAAKQNSTLATSEVVKNDFLFFGQKLDADTKGAGLGVINQTIPEHIDAAVTRNVSLMNNRVYRAGGYYKSRVSGEPYSTSGGAFFYNRAAYAHDNGITAIDFYGYPKSTAYSYAPVVDYPTAKLSSMDRADGVTRNLLVYANSEAEVTTGALKSYVYNEDTPEGNIKMHVIKPVVTPAVDPEPEKVTPTTAYLHLVERTAGSKDAEGNTCWNNDFDAPIAFNVTQRAWYTRQPAYYAENNNDAWEGITLPFTATKVEASLNGEITHFYGTPTEAQLNAPETNDKTLHHEYWLRGLTAVGDGTGAQAGNKVATFQRPGAESGLFGSSIPSGSSYSSIASIPSLVFNNTWFKTTYEDKNYNWDDPSDQNKWYSESHTYADYKPLTADVPYIVSFPGNRYYEFDLSSQFYNDMMSGSEAPQTVTFNAFANGYDGEEDAPNKATDVIAISTTSAMKTTVGGYDHVGTYLNLDKATDIYAMAETGTQFQNAAVDVLPFRTYMTTTKASGAKRIVIGGTSERVGVESVHGDPDEGPNAKGMVAYSVKRDIIIESDYAADVLIYNVAGQLVRAVKVYEGSNLYTGFAPGIYVINGTKLSVK